MGAMTRNQVSTTFTVFQGSQRPVPLLFNYPLYDLIFAGPPASIQLDVLSVPGCGAVSVLCSVSGCVPPPVLTLSTVPGSVIPLTSVYTSANTSTATASVILPDSAAIQCMVAVSGTNYTQTVTQYYTRYTQHQDTVARPYTSDSLSGNTSDYLATILVILLLILYQVQK